MFLSFFFWCESRQWAKASSLSRRHHQTQHIPRPVGTSRRVITPTQRYLHNTQHSQPRDIYAAGGIRTRNPSILVAADPRLRPRDYWDRHESYVMCRKLHFQLLSSQNHHKQPAVKKRSLAIACWFIYSHYI
jgi:SMC interacting uncharacterized protein involved in chromosome segregation